MKHDRLTSRRLLLNTSQNDHSLHHFGGALQLLFFILRRSSETSAPLAHRLSHHGTILQQLKVKP